MIDSLELDSEHSTIEEYLSLEYVDQHAQLIKPPTDAEIFLVFPWNSCSVDSNIKISELFRKPS